MRHERATLPPYNILYDPYSNMKSYGRPYFFCLRVLAIKVLCRPFLTNKRSSTGILRSGEAAKQFCLPDSTFLPSALAGLSIKLYVDPSDV